MTDVWRQARYAGACLKVHANVPRPGHETSPDTNWVKALGLGIRGWDGQFLPAWRASLCHIALCLASSSDAAARCRLARRQRSAARCRLPFPAWNTEVGPFFLPRDSRLTEKRTSDSEKPQPPDANSKKLFLFSPEEKESQHEPLPANLGRSAFWES